MRTLVISDLHLGRVGGDDVLRAPQPLARLVDRLRTVDRLVLLGDTLELRERPAHVVFGLAHPVLSAIGAAMAGIDREIVVVPGNHDHDLVRSWHRARLTGGHPALGLDQRISGEAASPLAAEVAGALAPASVTFAYPGLWLDDGVYATHGHYLDVHSRIPTFERLASGLTSRVAGPVPTVGAEPDDYERVLAPNYAWLATVAERALASNAGAGSRSGIRVYEALVGADRSARGRAIRLAFPIAVAALNRAGFGPLQADVSGSALRSGLLEGMHEVVARLDIRAAHVILGHTHRPGPFHEDCQRIWRRNGTALHNAGTWVFEPHFALHSGSPTPSWPGTAVAVLPGIAPVVERLLAGVEASSLQVSSRSSPLLRS